MAMALAHEFDPEAPVVEAMQELHNNLMELKNQGTFDVQKLHEMLNAQGKGMGQAFAFHTGKPRHRFDVNADGSIEVSIRKGDSEMSQSFKNEADMAQRRPDLYEKYEAVKAADGMKSRRAGSPRGLAISETSWGGA